jgi:Flp pilus assembly protein TadG
MRISKYIRNQNGSLSTMTALSIVVILSCAGAAIDFARVAEAKTELNAAMDSAVLAGTQYLAENDGDEAGALNVSKLLFDAELKNSAFAINQVKFKINSKGNGVASYGKAEISSTLLGVVGIETLPVQSEHVAEAAVAEAGSAAPSGDLEISLMLDVTGSMCDDGNGPCPSSTKLDALKVAAKELVDTVVWDNQTTYTSKVAIVPFSTRVRVGPDAGGSSAMKKMTNLEPNWTGWYKTCTSGSGGGGSESGGGWVCNAYKTEKVNNWKLMPCVTDRFYDSGWKYELTDQAPGVGAYLNAHDGSRMGEGTDSSSKKATSGVGKKSSDPSTSWNYSPDGMCYDVAQSNEVIALTNDKDDLIDKINNLEAYGSTSGVLGTAFSWYMLSPEWKTVWTGQSQPKSYELLAQKTAQGKPKLRKIAILMTDGVYNTYRGWKDQNIDDVSAAAVQMCTNMKAKGIEIYTVGFALASLPATEKATATSTLQSCGTTVDHFYNSLDATQLKTAFKEISENVSETYTRISK